MAELQLGADAVAPQRKTSTSDGQRSNTNEPARPELERDRSKSIAALLAAGIALAILALWKFVTWKELVSTIVLPAPEEVAVALWYGLVAGPTTWWGDIVVTLNETMIGFAAGVTIAMALGALFAYVPILRMAAYPFVVFMQTFPKIAIAPVLVAWLGYGILPKVVIGALLAFFPVFTNTVAGLSQIDPDEIRLLRSFGATRWQELLTLRLPNALPYIFAAMDVAVVVSLLGVIVGEFVGAEQGLGYRIQARTGFGDMASVYAVLFILGCMGTALHQVMRLLRSRLVFHE